MTKIKQKLIVALLTLAAAGIGSMIYFKKNNSNNIIKNTTVSKDEEENSSTPADALSEEQQDRDIKTRPSPWGKEMTPGQASNNSKDNYKNKIDEDLRINQKALTVLSAKMQAMNDTDRQDPLKVAKIIDELQAALGTSKFQGIQLDVIGENLRNTDKLMKEAKKIEAELAGIDVNNMKEKDFEKIRSLNIQPLTAAAKQINPRITDNTESYLPKKNQ